MFKKIRTITAESCRSFVAALADHYTLLLMLVTAAGLFLRLYGLGNASISMDEAVDIFLSGLSISDIWAYIAHGFIFHPPLFYWVQHIVLLVGTGEFIVRLPSALYGALTIPVVYLLGKEFHSRDIGILSAGLLALSPFHIFYSQDARPYAMMLLFCAIASVYFMEAIRTDSGNAWALFGIFSGLSAWTVFYAAVLTFSLMLFVVIDRRRRILRGFDENRALYVGGIFYLIVIMPLAGMIRDLFVLREVSDVTWGLKGLDVVTESFKDFYSHNELLMAVAIIMLIIGIAGLYQYDRRKCALLATMIFMPLAVSILVSYKLAIEPRYALIILPALVVGMAMTCAVADHLVRQQKILSRMGILVLFLLFITALSIPPVHDLYTSTVKFNQDWRNMSVTVSALTGPGDVVIILPDYMARPFDYYYSAEREGTTEFAVTSIAQLEKAYRIKGSHRMVIVEDADHQAPPMQWVLARADLCFSEGEVSVYCIR
ncbi:MAG: glycosyltransferase family 39 protein [Methanoregula sp.]|jgi:4-amino-4-deoxy-L-arabinose transferase-like glycosyltransferase